MNIDDNIIFLFRNEIREGIISEIKTTRTGIIYKIEFMDEYDEICLAEINSKLAFKTVDDLLNNLKNTYENKNEYCS